MPKKRKNPGAFKKGHDPRRHPLTTAERRRGGRNALARLMDENPSLCAWLQKKIGRTARPETLAAYTENRRRRARGHAELPVAS